MRPLAQLCARLGYTFDDPDLARAALTHRSAGGAHNERLEFLGDALLDLVISDRLFHLAADADEGDLSRLRSSLVRRDTLAQIATELELGDFLAMGAGELRSGGFRRRSILADALEAMLGAIYLDGGYAAARACVLSLYAQRLQSLPDAAELRDPKTCLQELLQARGLERPSYEVVDISGQSHRQTFRVRCVVADRDIRTEGTGTSRRRAEQQAAAAALAAIGADTGPA